MPEGVTARHLPPASPELRAPSGMSDRADYRRRRQHPGRVGRPSEDDETEGATAIAVFEAMRREATPQELAAEIGAGQDGKRARDLMKTAKERLASRIDEYVDIHLVAAKIAALEGDAKPAQWALENIAIEGERAVDPPAKNLPPPAPNFNLGFVIGGMPAPVRALPAKE